MTDEALLKLKTLHVGAPSPEARKLALNAAMVAFEDAQSKRPRAAATGVMDAPKRWFSNRWNLGSALAGLGTVTAAVVLLPLGTQYATMNSRAPSVDKSLATTVATSTAPVSTNAAGGTVSLQVEEGGKTALKQPVMEKPMPPKDAVPVAANAPATESDEARLAVTSDALAAMPAAPTAKIAGQVAMRSGVANMEAPTVAPMASTSLGYAAMEPSGDSFQKFDENRVKITKDEPVSTFSIDVDTASYSYVRGLIEAGSLPEPDAVRLEEMINYFPYDYPAPATADTPFKATMQVFPTPWNKKTQLLEIGIKGYVQPPSERKPEALTFLIDTSGSMDEPNKLPLLKRSFSLLVDNLQPSDTVSIVTYAGSAGLVLKPTKASDKAAILSALDNLEAGGSTAGAEGIELAYQVAAQNKVADGVNRVILATDGDFNVGIDTPDELKTFIKSKRDEGISLSVLGFGRGNLDDALMQALAQNGNGNASYIDNLHEAQKVLVEEAGSTFITIAKDVKVQVEFNPAQVSEYRLIGYETRALNREDFNNDAVDAGEIGEGHTVTALYEITPAGSGADLNDPLRYGSSAQATGVSDELGFLKLRYKAPDGDVSKLITAPITKDLVTDDVAKVGNDQRFAAAVAAFGQKLKGSLYGTGMSWQGIIDLANGAKGADPDGYRAEFVQLVKLTSALSPDHGGVAVPSDAPPPPSVEPPSID